jgi:hypothetical protein
VERKVLILTNSDDDLHVKPVQERLTALGKDFFRFDVDQLGSGKLKIEFASHENQFFVAKTSDKKTTSSDIQSVWYRRPNYFNFPIADPVQRDFAEKETTALLNGICACLPEVYWLNNPRDMEIAKNKVMQLRKARSIGFDVPRTIVTNNPDSVKDFFELCGGNIVFKTMALGFLDYGEKGFNVPTTLITETHLGKLGLITSCPSLFQELVDKKYDIRVTIVGDKVFAVKIDSQKHSATSIDWRKPQFISELGYQIVDLPDTVKNMCLKITHDLGLRFGAIDLALSKDGKYYFFEINPNGQWQWVEYFTGACISGAIADMLASENPIQKGG